MKKIYIFENLDTVSTNYHSGGGLAVICDNAERLYEILEIEREFSNGRVKIFDIVADFDDLIYFPDAGCC